MITNTKDVLALGGVILALSLIALLMIWLLDTSFIWTRRRIYFWLRVATGVAAVLLRSPDNRFPSARMIEVSICQECGYAGPLGQPACPRCAHIEKERQH